MDSGRRPDPAAAGTATGAAAGPPLGAILAGGRSRRFGGEPKALAEVGGRPILDRVRTALEAAVGDVVLIVNEPEPYERFGMEMRGDAFADAGPLAGLHAALAWAVERDRPGAVCVACDMPFVTADVFRGLCARALEAGADAVAPESGGPGGVEPLCAYYSTAALGTIEARVRDGARELVGLLDALDVAVVPRTDVEAWGDPAVLFMNVNDRTELRRARKAAGAAPQRAGGRP